MGCVRLNAVVGGERGLHRRDRRDDDHFVRTLSRNLRRDDTVLDVFANANQPVAHSQRPLQVVVADVAVGNRHLHRTPAMLHEFAGRIGDNRSIVHGRDREFDRTNLRVEVAIGRHVGERVDSVGVGIGRVEQRTVGIQFQRSQRRTVDEHRLQRVVVNVAIVAQDAGRREFQRLVLVRGERVVHGDWPIVDWRHGQRHDRGLRH